MEWGFIDYIMLAVTTLICAVGIGSVCVGYKALEDFLNA